MLVLVEHAAGVPRRACLEALGRARELGMSPVALVCAADPSAAAAACAPFADRVLAAASEDLERYNADAHLAVAGRAIDELSPLLVAGPATSTGRDLVARLSVRRDGPCAAEITGLELEDGRPLVQRPVHGGKAIATVALEGSGPAFVTVRANAFAVPEPGTSGPVESLDAGIDPSSLRMRVTGVEETGGGRVGVTEADVVVSGGRGLGDPENFALLEQLADRLGAAVGASRAVVDAGWRDASEQVGKSGNTVAPRLYVAFGVSGAVHHVMGMDGSAVVVVVNKDPNALFFQHADHGLVADALEVLPALVEALGD
jgi:electron transfer flavoprotein alpha subunit